MPERFPFEITLPARLEAAIDVLRAQGGRCRVVGGSVRDALLGLAPKDFDIEVYGLELDAIATALSKIGKTDLVGKSFAVVKLWTRGEEYDFAIPRRETKTGSGHRGFSIEADAHMEEAEAIQRRDFTINALLYDPHKREVLDYCKGKQDLDQGILRHVSEAFREDPLRVLRAMQFAGRFNMRLHPDTAQLCRSMRSEFSTLAKERIWIEWQKWASKSTALSAGLRALEQSGWIDFFPELQALLSMPQDPEWHPEGGVWPHTQCCLDALQSCTDWSEQASDKRALLAFATLCHDLGKATCTQFAEKKGSMRWISPGHDAASVGLSDAFLDRIAAPHYYRERVPKLVGAHHFLNSTPEDGPSDSSLRRLSQRIKPATTDELVYVLIADHRGRPPLISEQQELRIALFQRRIQELDLKDSAPQPILLGRHLIAAGLQPGIAFKEILDAAFEAQLEGAFKDEAGAIAWLSNRA